MNWKIAWSSAQGPAPLPLLQPLGWAADTLLNIIEEPLLRDLVSIDRPRMHLIALALAHVDVKDDPGLGRLLLCGSATAILEQLLGFCPAGIRGACRRMPEVVLEPDSYRRLLDLLCEPSSAKAIFHAARIDDTTVDFLCALPPKLRTPAILSLEGSVHHLGRFGEALRFLAARNGAPSFDGIVDEIASLRTAHQVIGLIARLCENLPLPGPLPDRIGHARRVDGVEEIRTLAKSWRNCLADYVPTINKGQCALYVWTQRRASAACLLNRKGRLGWCVYDTKGPHNSEPSPTLATQIAVDFAAAGFPDQSVIDTLESIVEAATEDPQHSLDDTDLWSEEMV